MVPTVPYITTEKLDIEYEFLIGDVVYVKDYGKELFRVIGHRTEIWRYLEDGWEVIFNIQFLHIDDHALIIFIKLDGRFKIKHFIMIDDSV
jgi:hypothetical protein